MTDFYIDELPEFECCSECGGLIFWQDCPTGGWWIHDEHPADDHDAVNLGSDY